MRYSGSCSTSLSQWNSQICTIEDRTFLICANRDQVWCGIEVMTINDKAKTAEMRESCFDVPDGFEAGLSSKTLTILLPGNT